MGIVLKLYRIYTPASTVPRMTLRNISFLHNSAKSVDMHLRYDLSYMITRILYPLQLIIHGGENMGICRIFIKNYNIVSAA